MCVIINQQITFSSKNPESKYGVESWMILFKIITIIKYLINSNKIVTKYVTKYVYESIDIFC